MIVQFGADSPDSVLDQIAGYAQQAVAIAEPVLAVADKLIKLKAAVSAAAEDTVSRTQSSGETSREVPSLSAHR